MKILIQNGRVVDPASGRDELADVAIAAGRIVSIGAVPADFAPNKTMDASGCVVAPGCVVSVAPGCVVAPGAGASPGAAVDWAGAVALICLPGSTETGPELAA